MGARSYDRHCYVKGWNRAGSDPGMLEFTVEESERNAGRMLAEMLQPRNYKRIRTGKDFKFGEFSAAWYFHLLGAHHRRLAIGYGVDPGDLADQTRYRSIPVPAGVS